MTGSRWVEEWMRAWRSFPDPGQGNPWTAMLEHFTKSHPASHQQAFADALDKITGQSRAFFDLGQTLAANDGEDWRESVQRYLEELSARLQDPEALADAFGAASPLGYWRQIAGHQDDAAGGQPSLMAQFDQLLKMPGLGYTRERQESLQELSRLWLQYERAFSEYAAYCAETARRSVDRLHERMRAEFDRGAGPESIRALYDAWAACSEEVYAERVATSEYMKLHGRMVNALMAYRARAGRLMDDWARAANMPTREEVDALHRTLKETRAELRVLRAEVADGTGEPAPGRRKKQKNGKKRKNRKKRTKKVNGRQ